MTCCDSALNCLVLFKSTILDRVLVGFINASSTSTVISLNDTFGDGYVVVYSWNSSQSIFEGEVSLIISELDLPTVTSLTPCSGIIGALVVVITSIVLIIIIVVVLCLVKKVKRGGKGFRSRYKHYLGM